MDYRVFKDGEKYDYVTDMHRLYKESLSESLEDKIFKTLPSHVFHDIKKPRTDQYTPQGMSTYNPWKQKEFNNFFEARDWYQYRSDMDKTPNRGTNKSRHVKY